MAELNCDLMANPERSGESRERQSTTRGKVLQEQGVCNAERQREREREREISCEP